jgi:hypothetical protein
MTDGDEVGGRVDRRVVHARAERRGDLAGVGVGLDADEDEGDPVPRRAQVLARGLVVGIRIRRAERREAPGESADDGPPIVDLADRSDVEAAEASADGRVEDEGVGLSELLDLAGDGPPRL